MYRKKNLMPGKKKKSRGEGEKMHVFFFFSSLRSSLFNRYTHTQAAQFCRFSLFFTLVR